jgi:hypothetical protein
MSDESTERAPQSNAKKSHVMKRLHEHLRLHLSIYKAAASLNTYIILIRYRPSDTLGYLRTRSDYCDAIISGQRVVNI